MTDEWKYNSTPLALGTVPVHFKGFTYNGDSRPTQSRSRLNQGLLSRKPFFKLAKVVGSLIPIKEASNPRALSRCLQPFFYKRLRIVRRRQGRGGDLQKLQAEEPSVQPQQLSPVQDAILLSPQYQGVGVNPHHPLFRVEAPALHETEHAFLLSLPEAVQPANL